MSDQPLVASVDTAAVPAPGYYPDPSVPGFVRYWNGATWVPGTSRPAPAEGEVLVAPAFAARPAVRPNARYIPPPSVPQPAPVVEPAVAVEPVAGVEPAAVVESAAAPTVVGAPVVGAPVVGAQAAGAPADAPDAVVETGPVFLDQTSAGAVFTMAPLEEAAPGGGGWQVDAREQPGLLETGSGPRWVSWGRLGDAPAPAAEAGGGSTGSSAVEPAPEPEARPAVPAARSGGAPVREGGRSGAASTAGARSGGGAASARSAAVAVPARSGKSVQPTSRAGATAATTAARTSSPPATARPARS
ncbi:DUF2510 domain-containing protein, partial [Kitasatospora sp. LaBMicrA B282]|uniref:DUF2510 domain-containing protein n=1 Tax=Kitasatospora sp. LaBMicrA B282 TaxID=3420949 RepID=UPI003D117040